jgi:hypothetical protein
MMWTSVSPSGAGSEGAVCAAGADAEGEDCALVEAASAVSTGLEVGSVDVVVESLNAETVSELSRVAVDENTSAGAPSVVVELASSWAKAGLTIKSLLLLRSSKRSLPRPRQFSWAYNIILLDS